MGTRWAELRLEGGPLDGERLQRNYPPPSECVVVTLGGRPIDQLPRWLPTELEDRSYRYETYILVGGDQESYHYFYEPIARRNRLRRRLERRRGGPPLRRALDALEPRCGSLGDSRLVDDAATRS